MMRESEQDDEVLLRGNRRRGIPYEWKKTILSEKNRTWVKLIAISIAISLVIGIIILAVGLTHRKPEEPVIKEDFGWEQVFNSSFSPKSKSVSWDISGDLMSFVDENGNIAAYFGTNSNSSIILDLNHLKSSCPSDFPSCETFQGYELSVDRSWIALSYEHKAIFRHSYDAKWLLVKLSSTPVFVQVFKNETLSLFDWSSSKSTDNALFFSFVSKNNLFVGKLEGDASVSFTQVSQDGSETIFNGICDWVYEEEVFSASPAFWWNPSSTHIAFLRLDDSNVPIYDYEYYDEKNSTYPQLVQIRYPKVDAKNPVASVVVYEIASQSKIVLNLTIDFEYVTSVQWENSTSFLVTVVPRIQNSETILRYQVGEHVGTVLIVRNEPGWIEQTPLLVVDDSLLRIVPDNNNGGFRHIAQYDRSSGQLSKFLTSGSFDVSQIVGYSSLSQKLFFISSQVSSVERQLYSISLPNSNQVTQLFDLHGTYSASLNPSGKVLLVSFSSPDNKNPSTQILYSINADGTLAKSFDLVDNSNLIKLRDSFNYVDKQWITLKTADGQDMNAAIMFPPSYDQKGEYCLLVNVYGGPESQMTAKRDYFSGFAPYLATSLKCLVASIDGRGTGSRGSTFSKSVFQHLGSLETQDQIEGVRQLIDKYPIAKNKIGIWGGSYGGFMTLKSISRKNTPFSFGVSMAPVTDWRFYDTFYTEKYMQTTSINEKGYHSTSLLYDKEGIKRISGGEGLNKLLLIHGIADDNVHFQNSAELVKVLVNNRVQFDSFYYPNRNHGLRTDVRTGEDSVQKHLLKMIYNFFSARVK